MALSAGIYLLFTKGTISGQESCQLLPAVSVLNAADSFYARYR